MAVRKQQLSLFKDSPPAAAGRPGWHHCLAVLKAGGGGTEGWPGLTRQTLLAHCSFLGPQSESWEGGQLVCLFVCLFTLCKLFFEKFF